MCWSVAVESVEYSFQSAKKLLPVATAACQIAILQVGGVEPPETSIPRSEYIIAGRGIDWSFDMFRPTPNGFATKIPVNQTDLAGAPLEQISIAEPLAKNGETCLSPQAWEHVTRCRLVQSATSGARNWRRYSHFMPMQCDSLAIRVWTQGGGDQVFSNQESSKQWVLADVSSKWRALNSDPSTYSVDGCSSKVKDYIFPDTSRELVAWRQKLFGQLSITRSLLWLWLYWLTPRLKRGSGLKGMQWCTMKYDSTTKSESWRIVNPKMAKNTIIRKHFHAVRSWWTDIWGEPSFPSFGKIGWVQVYFPNGESVSSRERHAEGLGMAAFFAGFIGFIDPYACWRES